MDNTIVAAMIAVAGSLFGVWIGGRISRETAKETIAASHRHAIELIHINDKKLAGLRLREAFIPELSLFQYPKGYGIAEIPHILTMAFERHLRAVNEFRFFLEGSELDSFNKTWKEYDDYPDFNKYMVFPATEKKDIQKAIDNIEAILAFTKDK